MAYTLQTKKSDGTLEDVTIETITIDITSYKNKAIPSTIYNLLKNSQSSKVIVDNKIYYIISNNGSILKFSYCDEAQLKRITINSNGSSWYIESNSLYDKLDTNQQLANYDTNTAAPEYTGLSLLDGKDNTLVQIPFRKINGESIIGEDPLVISGGGTSHPIYTEVNTDKYEILGNGTTDNCKFKFTGESGSRYYFNLAGEVNNNPLSFQGNMLELEIVNTDVEVIFFSTITDQTWYDHQITGSPNAVCLTNANGKLILVTFDAIAKERMELTTSGRDESISNSLMYGTTYDNSVNVNIGAGEPSQATAYANNLIISMRKDDVGILHVTIGAQYEV